MYKQIATIAVTAALTLAGGAQAQLGNGGAKYDGIEQGEIGAAGYDNQYVGIAQQAFAAQSGLLSMLGLNPEAAAVAAAGRDLQPTATRAALEEALKQQADAAELLTRRFASAQPVAADSRIRFGQDVAALAQAVSDSAAIAKSMAGNRKKLGAASGAGAVQAVYLSKALGDHVKQLQQSLKAAAGYAAANGIVLPPAVAAAAG
ncbi:MAG: hypothetical protein K2X55_00070 [Burkholderiaceae bacterium]|nr:hypothetical protein [Burkholderiaceae bacterium]